MNRNEFWKSKNYEGFLKVTKYRGEMSKYEEDALFAELLSNYFFNNSSDLIDLLEDDKFLEFKALAKYINDTGSKIKKIMEEK